MTVPTRSRAFWAWLVVALWLAVIALESTDWLSATHTGGFLYSIVTSLFGHVDVRKFEIFHAVVRKCGHFVGYGVLSILLFRAFRATFATTLIRLCGLSVAFTCLIASLDEWHQTFLPSRTGAVHDVVLDTFGAICMQAAILVFLHTKTPPQTYTDVPG